MTIRSIKDYERTRGMTVNEDIMGERFYGCDVDGVHYMVSDVDWDREVPNPGVIYRLIRHSEETKTATVVNVIDRERIERFIIMLREEKSILFEGELEERAEEERAFD